MAETPSSARSARWVAAGILLSRITGLIRESVIGYYFGISLYADVVRTALRMPNVLQNLLGEGTLSASFIPVYAELLEEGKKEEAGRVAGAVFALLVALAGALALLGIFLAPVLVSIFTPGFEGLRRELTILAIRIIFPMAGILVLSAWALGILNSHRRFFVSYVAPVAWNAAMIAALFLFGGRIGPGRLVVAFAWGALVGGLLQFAVQLPWVFSLERRLRVSLDFRLEGLRETVRNAVPAIMGRGVVQLSGYIEVFLASFVYTGVIATLGYAQTLYLLPISLFGMSIAAAELPELSRQRRQAQEVIRNRVRGALERMAFYVVPSVVGYLVLGDVIIAAIFQRGAFGPGQTLATYAVLCGYTLGLLASTGCRVFSSTFFALHDTRTPARIAAARVAVSAALGGGLMFALAPLQLGGESLGALGIAIGAAVGSWFEWVLLRRALRPRVGAVKMSKAVIGRMITAAVIAGAVGRGIFLLLPTINVIATAVAVLIPYAATYFLVGSLLGLDQARQVLKRIVGGDRR